MERIKASIAYFFGQGEEIEFTNFTPAHFLPIILLLLTVLIIGLFRKQIAKSRFEKNFRFILAFVMIVTEMSYFWRLVGVPSLGANPVDHLPITLCGWSVIFCSYMLVGKSQRLYDISYFWLFSGTVFALITPTVISYCGPTRFRYYQFWLEHTTGYIAIFYMTFVHKMRPNLRSIARSYSLLGVLTVIAYFANRALGPGANYLFMAEPEATPSILDILPPNFTIRFLVMMSIITLMFFLAYLPWLIKDKRAKRYDP